jgi:hypothetical protein
VAAFQLKDCFGLPAAGQSESAKVFAVPAQSAVALPSQTHSMSSRVFSKTTEPPPLGATVEQDFAP